MSASGKLLALRRKIGELGLAAALGYALRTLWRAAFDRDEILFSVTLHGYRRPASYAVAGATVRRVVRAEDLTAADSSALAAYAGDGHLARVRVRLSEGWQLFLVDLDGRVAGGGWVLTTATGRASQVVPLLAGDVTIIDCFTFPEARGRGAYTALLVGIAEHFRDAGGVRAFIFTRRHNVASLRGIGKAGFAPEVVYQTFHLGAREWVCWKRRVAADEPISGSRA